MSTFLEVPEINSPHIEAARAIHQVLRKALGQIEGLVFISPNERQRIHVSASVPDELLELLAVTLDASERLRVAIELTPAVLRDAIAYRQAYIGVADELERWARGIRDTVMVRLSRVGTEGLRAYGVAQKLNRAGDREQLIPHLKQMQRILKRGRRKPEVEDPPPVEPQSGVAA